MTKDNSIGVFPIMLPSGLSLRDYFAAAAMQGLLANSEGVHSGGEPATSVLSGDRLHLFAEFLAERAGAIADAMLRERVSE